MRILVTGAAGFIGSHLCDNLIHKGYSVIAVDDYSLGKKENIEHLFNHNLFEFIELDLVNKDSILNLFNNKKIEVVFHLAANSDIRRGIQQTDLDLNRNFVTTYNILESMRLNSVKNLIFASTSAIYGNVDSVIKESHGPLFPTSFYGASKLASEAYISAYSEIFNFKTWIVRFPNVIGSRLTHGVIFDFIKKLEKNSSKLTILGDGKQKKPYLHVNDLISAIIKIWNESSENINYYNIGVKSQTTVDEIAAMVIKGMKLKNVNLDYTGGKKGWPGDVPSFNYDITKLEGLGWKPTYTSNEAVSKTIEDLLSK